MKTIFKYLLTTALLCVTLPAVTSEKNMQPGVSVGFQVFYNELSPYGTWVDYPTYGYVWMPFEGPDFIPYGTNGHWVWTADGWL
jgi:hypothetical protein